MPRKTQVPDPISKLIGGFSISRDLKNRLLSALHLDLPEHGVHYQNFRLHNDERAFTYRVLLDEGSTRHLFVVTVDDTTSPDHYILLDVQHRTRDVRS